jgi:hypothetical protein
MCNDASSGNYDPEFAEAYEEAIRIRGPADPSREIPAELSMPSPKRTNSNGFIKAAHLTDGELEEFLEMVRDGKRAALAAKEIGTSITQINRRSNRDAGFGQAFRDAQEEGLEAYRENLRAEATRQAFAGDYRALRDQMIMHLEEAGAITTSKHEVGGFDGASIRILAERHFGDLPPELLDQMIAHLEKRELGELEAGNGSG